MRRVIGILDYGVGNCGSIEGLVSRVGHKSKIIHALKDFNGVDVLVLPGVGALPPVMKIIQSRGLSEGITDFHRKGNLMMGICLGMQLLADSSEEHDHTNALGLIPGSVVPLSKGIFHVGWNSLDLQDSYLSKKIRDNLSGMYDFYFNHGYKFEPKDETMVLARSEMLGEMVPAILKKDNILGFQFHPEVSQVAGEVLIKTLIEDHFLESSYA